MAMSTTLFAISTDALRDLEANPKSIGEITSKDTFNTYLWTTLPYFLTGSQEEREDDDCGEAHSLSAVLDGVRSVSCQRLENGAFYVVPAEDVGRLSGLLREVDREALRCAILDAELEEISDGEVWEELEQVGLSDPEEVARSVLDDLESLTSFYADTSRAGHAIVGYTT